MKEKTELLTNAIFDNLDHLLIATDTNGIITKFNKAAEKFLGYSAEEIVGLLSPAIFHLGSEVVERAELFSKELKRDIQPGFEVFVAKTDLGLANEHEWTYVTKSGEHKPVLLSITALRNEEDKVIGYIGVAKDITQLKLVQQSLIEAKEHAENANKSKSRFLANMSHEIRTPLNAIMGFIELLQKHEVDPKKIDYLDIIQTSSKSLLAVINDILDLSKIEDGSMKIELIDFNLAQDLNELINFFKSITDAQSISLNFDYPSELSTNVHTDPLRLKQILSNLITNAIKFSPNNATIDISLHRKDEFVYLSIKDEGIGISEEAQQRIFNPFEQAEVSTTRSYGGTGLGLSISKKLIELLGGTISIESELNQGSTFSFSFKAPEVYLLEEEKSDNVEPELQGHILVAEDNKTNQLLISILLDEMNLSYTLVEDGQKALDTFTSKEYDLILMDINMPNVDGIEATKRIRQSSHAHNDIPIIALTANVMKEDIDHYLQSGMNDHIPKPIDSAILLKTLSYYL